MHDYEISYIFRMVEDILNTRLMVKKSMKDYKEDKVK